MAGNNWDYEQSPPPLNDTKVDRLLEVPSGEIDQLPPLGFDFPDNQIIKNLDNRIDDSVEYFDQPDGHNLRKARGDNQRLVLGKQLDVRSLYRFQIPYIENQIYIAENAIVAYLTAQTPQPEVTPAQDTPIAKKFASDFEKIHMAHAQKVNLQQLLENTVRAALRKRIGLIYFEFDPYHGENGEVIPRALNPEEVVVDKNAKQGENPEFIARMVKMSINEMCSRWPDKKEAIYEEFGIKRRGARNVEQIAIVREVWVTLYDKDYEPQEGVVWYTGNLVLEKIKNPNWLYSRRNKNFLAMPRKPFVALNLENDGDHWIDMTSSIEQASPLQFILNKRGRQFMEVVDKANGVLVIDTASGISKDDAQNLTGDPNQKIVITAPPGKRAQDVIYQIPPPQVPNALQSDKIDIRTQVHAIMGTPSEFTGASDGKNDDQTLGEAMMKKNQASGRQDLYVRAIDRFLTQYFNMLTQMMVVWYDSKHYFVYNGGDGEFDYVVASRELIDAGMTIDVKSGTTLPFDKQRQEAITLQLLKMGGSLSLLDAYKLLHMQNPQQLYDNWAKQQADPQSLARDALNDVDETKAYVAYVEIMNGKNADDPVNVDQEFILTLRKLMLRDDFLKADRKYQQKFLDYVNKAIDSLDLRNALDQASQSGTDALRPQNPLQPAMGPGIPGQPPMQPPTGRGGQMPPAGQPPMGGMSPQQPPMGGPLPESVTNGTPLQNPAAPATPQPGNVSAIPVF